MAREIVENTKADATSTGSDLAELYALLDAVGLFPVLGEAADIANALIYLSQGDTKNAILSAVGAVPGVGLAVTVGKWGGKALPYLDNVLDGLKNGWNKSVSSLNNSRGSISINGVMLGVPGVAKEVNQKYKKLSEKYIADGIPPLHPKELIVGTYAKVKKPPIAMVGDRMTGHHAPSANYMKKHGVKKDDGITVNMYDIRHIATDSYGRKETDMARYLSLSPRDALAFDTIDMRNIYRISGIDRKTVNNAMKENIRQNLDKHPALFRK